MFLRQLDISNFRGIKKLSLTLDKTTVLIGENNIGKSTILAALQFCLNRSITRRSGIFTEYDYHLSNKDSQPADAEPIELILRFSEQKENEWPDEVVQMLFDAVQVNDEGLQSITLRISSGYDEAIGDFKTIWDFLDLKDNVLTKAKDFRHIAQLHQLAPAFYLAALRDAAQEFRPRSQFWGPFVSTLKIEDGLREEIEQSLSDLNQRVLDAHQSFGAVKERLRNTGKLVPLGADDPVRIEALPGKVFDLLSRTQVMLTSKTGVRLPIGRHGEGTQSLAVICLFDAFLQSQLENGYNEYSEPILTLEEPEAHLHPSAIRAVAHLLQELKGQKVIATHSSDLVASVPLTSLRRLRRTDGNITVYQIQPGALTADELNKLDYHVRLTRGNLLFARCWLLVEGETDPTIFNESARILGYSLFSDGVCCVEYAQVGVEKFIKLADQLGIAWVVVGDNDPQGQGYIRTAKQHLNGRLESDHLHLLRHGDMEVFLCMEGYCDIFEGNLSPQKQGNITAPKGTIDYCRQVVDARSNDFKKPKAAITVIEEMEKRGPVGVPTQIQQIIERVLKLAAEVA
jgi:putative ATP-dependent endonuclease of OLD family